MVFKKVWEEWKAPKDITINWPFVLFGEASIEREDDPPDLHAYHTGDFTYFMQPLDILRTFILYYCNATKGLLMNSGWRPKRSFIGQINDFWTSVMNVFPQNRTFWRQKKLHAVARVTNLFCFVSGGGSTLY
jgi:hypothetical protein